LLSFPLIKLADTNKHERHKAVYMLLKLVPVLPVATASVERVFSIMNYVKNKLRNKIGDQYLNDWLVTSVEREFFLQGQRHHQPLPSHEESQG
jgi:hypothetical protein